MSSPAQAAWGICLLAACALPLAALATNFRSESQAATQEKALDNLVNNIIELRGAVEDLDSQLQTLKSEHKNKMSSLARREGELAAKKESQQLRKKKLERKLTELSEKTHETGAANEQLAPALHKAIEGMRGYLESSLPFKRGDREAALKEIRTQLDSGAVDPPRVANRLWSFYADEIRLTSQNGLHRQPIRIDGEEHLVDIARLGMMTLYFRAEDGRYGYAARTGPRWTYHYLDGDGSDNVAALFGALHKQIRSGFFQLPHPLGEKPIRQANAE